MTLLNDLGVKGSQIEGDNSAKLNGGLVDSDLSTDQQRAALRTKFSLIEPEGRRMMGVFLGDEDYEKIQEEMSIVMGDMLLGCLGEFVHEQGGKIVWATRPGGFHNQAVNAIQQVVKVGDRVLHILRDGYLFLHLPNERVAISAEPDANPPTGMTSVCVRSSVNSAEFFRRWREYAEEQNHLRGQAFFADGKIIERKHAYSWDNILLPEKTKCTIRTHVEGFLRNRLRLKGLGVKSRRGLILAGQPGTGKTLLGKVLADTLDASFIWVLPRHVSDPESFERILTMARFVTPAVVFLEDLDLFAEERGKGGDGILGELMNQLDGAIDNEDIVTVATTNHLKAIEEALRNRPGRFDRIIEFDAMDKDCRRSLFVKLLDKADVSKGDMNYLVESTNDYTGARIEELANTLYILAVEGDNNVQPTGDAEAENISISRQLIDAAIDDATFERKGKLGFHAA